MTAELIPSAAEAQAAVAEINVDLVPAIYVIHSQEELEQAAVLLRNVKTSKTRLEDLRKSMTRPIDDAKKNIMDIFKPQETKLAEAEKRIKSGVNAWNIEQERRRQQEEARLRDAQQKAQAKLEERAASAREKGQDNKADAILANIPPVPTVIAASAPPAGIGSRVTWHAEVTDMLALVRAVAAGQAPISYLEANTVALNAAARSMKDTMPVAGVRFYSKSDVTVRA